MTSEPTSTMRAVEATLFAAEEPLVIGNDDVQPLYDRQRGQSRQRVHQDRSGTELQILLVAAGAHAAPGAGSRNQGMHRQGQFHPFTSKLCPHRLGPSRAQVAKG